MRNGAEGRTMYVEYRVSDRQKALREADDLSSFKVVVAGGAALPAPARAEVTARIGTPAEDEVFVPIADLRGFAAGLGVQPGWYEKFDGMLGYAAKHGWVDDEGKAVRAHIEWV